MKGEEVRETPEPDLNLKVSAYIPQDYMPDPADKLAYYRQLSGLKAEEELSSIESDMRDRFGPLPPEVYALFEVMAVKLYLKKLGVKVIDFGNEKIVLTFSDNTSVQPQQVIELIQKDSATYRLREPNKFVVKCKTVTDILPIVRRLIEEWRVL